MAINVLIVDDSAVMRAMILKTLRMSGLSLGDIYQAADGRQGLKTLNEHWIDLVLLDISMPVMDGEQMIDCMIEDPDLKNIPIVVISTEGSQTRIERLQRKGARFVRKPFSPEIFRNTLKDILGAEAEYEREN